ncbi:TetR/AcrR family transcriptional regulator [Deltaproteobacteria bacterium TL4]
MPKAARNSSEIEVIKEKILSVAMEILCEEGFQYLSMRKLANRLNMTAANIYNYYSNKDEIYLGIQTNGFAMLQEAFEQVTQQSEEPFAQLEGMVRAYLEFGFKNPDYYEVMLNRNTPKYADYVGTALESVALIEKQTALQSANMATSIVTKLIQNKPFMPIQEARYHTLQVWTALHGIVSLYNNRVLQEMGENVEEMIERFVKDLVRSFYQYAQKQGEPL